MTLNPCHILAIDPGKTSGIAVFRNGKFIETAEVAISSPFVEWWVAYALSASIQVNAQLIMVGETWGKGGPRGMGQWQGLGASWKRWEWALEEAWKQERKKGRRQPAPKVLRVHTSTWRSKIFGGRVGKDLAKQMAVRTANTRFGLSLDPKEHNAAEAVCIGLWASYAPQVMEKIPKRFR